MTGASPTPPAHALERPQETADDVARHLIVGRFDVADAVRWRTAIARGAPARTDGRGASR